MLSASENRENRENRENKKVIDFSDVNIYPKKYWVNYKKGNMVFTIKSFAIENIEQQHKILLSKKSVLMIGDYISFDTKFGHNLAKKDGPENWIDVPISGVAKVTGIVPTDKNEIILEIEKCRKIP